MVRHFKTRLQAKKYKADQIKKGVSARSLVIRKKLKGHLNRKAKPFIVSSEMEWLNLY
jgi:hypothetical protein|tara:strand:- start:6671 stop:6844 length:174 start_codon:yes stop_codon:yes gene_type:complete